jgi:hypothetical protein
MTCALLSLAVLCALLPRSYAKCLPAKKPTLMLSPIPIDDNSTVHDYCFDKKKLR